MMKVVGMVAYRCQECNKRFYVNRETHEKLRKERRREEERKAQMADEVEAKPAV